MRLAGTQHRGLADGAAHYCAAAIGIGPREAERTSRYVGVRSVTRIRRSATRGSDVYRSRPTMTLNGIMRLAGTQRVRLANQHARGRARATLRIGDAGWVIARSQTGKNGAAG